jgi:ribokinase
MRVLRIDEHSPYRQLIGVGGIGTGMFFALEGDHILGREESRSGRLLDIRDYSKLHIITHHVARLLGANCGAPFHVIPIGLVGDDAPGRDALGAMAAAGIDTRLVRSVPGMPTLLSVCFQYPDGKGGNITASNSAAAALTDSDLDEAAALFSSQGVRTIALAVPEAPLKVRRHLLELATASGAFRAASFITAEIPSSKDSGIFDILDLVALNEDEAATFVGCHLDPDEPGPFVETCRTFLRANYPRLQTIVTVGKRGAYAFSGERFNHCPAPTAEVVSTAGAGDSLFGAVLAALAAGIPLLREELEGKPAANGTIESALDFGVALASFKCSSRHTISPRVSVDSVIDYGRRLKLIFSPRFETLFTEFSSFSS